MTRFLLFIILTASVLTACGNDEELVEGNMQYTARPAKNGKINDYDLAFQFLDKLKKEKADTILFYKRTCISCCDFYNIFWTDKGKKRLAKFYFDFTDMQTHADTIVLLHDSIFNILGKNYGALKNIPLKGNGHLNKDGTASFSVMDHYCYSYIKVYVSGDSSMAARIEDHAFDKYTDYDFDIHDTDHTRLTNDSYEENKNSKWNLLLTTTEHEIERLGCKPDRETERLRTRIKND